MISSMAKPGIDRQASGAEEFPARHGPPEHLKFEISDLRFQGPECGGCGASDWRRTRIENI
jgi:hypothetical protein